jgi:L-seryl-tRNA(Ser) seleniumtransferase
MPQSKLAGDSRLRLIPSVDQLLRTPTAGELTETLGVKKVTALARLVTAELRSVIRNEEVQTNQHTSESLLALGERRLREAATFESRSGIKKVINATGVILHTNLGRAPLSELAQRAIGEQAAGYCTLEYNTASGLRGKRGSIAL